MKKESLFFIDHGDGNLMEIGRTTMSLAKKMAKRFDREKGRVKLFEQKKGGNLKKIDF